MSSVIEFFSGLLDAVGAILDFIYNTVLDLVYLISLLNPVRGSIVGQLFNWLPLSIVTIISIIISISIVFRIIGRD